MLPTVISDFKGAPRDKYPPPSPTEKMLQTKSDYSSGGSRGGARGTRAPIILCKTKKRRRVAANPPPPSAPLAQGLDPSLYSFPIHNIEKGVGGRKAINEVSLMEKKKKMRWNYTTSPKSFH